MKLLVDMNLSPALCDTLAAHAWETVHWSSVGPSTAPDRQLMEWARSSSRCCGSTRARSKWARSSRRMRRRRGFGCCRSDSSSTVRDLEPLRFRIADGRRTVALASPVTRTERKLLPVLPVAEIGAPASCCARRPSNRRPSSSARPEPTPVDPALRAGTEATGAGERSRNRLSAASTCIAALAAACYDAACPPP